MGGRVSKTLAFLTYMVEAYDRTKASFLSEVDYISNQAEFSSDVGFHFGPDHTSYSVTCLAEISGSRLHILLVKVTSTRNTYNKKTIRETYLVISLPQ